MLLGFSACGGDAGDGHVGGMANVGSTEDTARKRSHCILVSPPLSHIVTPRDLYFVAASFTARSVPKGGGEGEERVWAGRWRMRSSGSRTSNCEGHPCTCPSSTSSYIGAWTGTVHGRAAERPVPWDLLSSDPPPFLALLALV